MNRNVMTVMICLAVIGVVGNGLAQQPVPAPAQVPVAGMSIGVTADELVTVARGWSVQKQIMGKDVYNENSEKVGVVSDLIVAPEKAVSYAIIGTGGFLGMDKHDVAIPMNQFKLEEGKITLPGATADAVKAMPTFQYPK
jgi:hypothetical protein